MLFTPAECRNDVPEPSMGIPAEGHRILYQRPAS
jgi:hypothetical protein